MLCFLVTMVLPSPAPISSAMLSPCPLHADHISISSSTCSELFQIINHAENKLFFFVGGFILLKNSLNKLQSFKHNTHGFVSTISEIWFQIILYRSAENNPLLYLIFGVDRLHSTAHAETVMLWIHILFIIKHPIIQHLIFNLNWELHHQYLILFQHTDKIIKHWRPKISAGYQKKHKHLVITSYL